MAWKYITRTHYKLLRERSKVGGLFELVSCFGFFYVVIVAASNAETSVPQGSQLRRGHPAQEIDALHQE